MPKDKPPTITQTTSIAKTRLFNVEAVDLDFANGEKRTYERLKRQHPGAVMMVPVTANDEFILIREFAVGVEAYELTFPKGFIDAGELPEQAANRELQEEIGFGAREFIELREVYTSAAYMQSHMNLVVARDLYPASLAGDEPEPLEIVHWPIADYNELLAQPDFISTTCVAALLLAREELKLDK